MAPTPFLSRHAAQRCDQMGLTFDDVEAAVADPDLTYPGDREYEQDGRRFYQRGDVLVLMDPSGSVITVLWHGREGRDPQPKETP